MMHSRVEIPKQHIPYLSKLLKMPASQQSELLAALEKAPPTLYIGDLAESLAPRVQIPESDLNEILLMFAGMYEGARRTGDPDEFVDLVIDAAKDIDELRDTVTNWAEIKTLISTILKLDRSLGVTAKALGVASDHEHVYCDSRILTDIRTVFSEDDVKPAAATIVHTVRMSFHDGGVTGRSPRSLYVAMDADDIESLLKQLKRAKEKELHLRDMLNKAGVPILSPEAR